MLKVMLVGIHPVVRQSLREILQKEPDFSVVGEVREIQEALVAMRALQPEVLVVDFALAGEKECAALKEAGNERREAPLRIVILGMSADREHVKHALRAGASAYLRTQDAAEELVTALRTATPKEPFLGAAIEREEIMGEIAAEKETRTKAKVLVVEDDADFAEVVRVTLASENYDVLLAASKEEGLALCRKEHPDAVILDVMMPEGTEGFHFVWDLRKEADEKLRRTPILMLTAIHDKSAFRFYPQEGDGTYEPYEYLPVQDFADKPLKPAQLLEKVRNLLADKSKAL